MDKLIDSWHNYWFCPAPLVNLAVLRILAVGFQLSFLFTQKILGSLVEKAALPDALYHPVLVLRSFTWLFGGPGRPPLDFFEIVFWTVVVAGVLALVGLGTNLCLALFAVGNVIMQAYLYSFGDHHHPEALMMIALLLLAMSPSGAVLSLDSLRKKRREEWGGRLLTAESRYARWPLLLVQWMLALVYVSATVSKLGKSGLDWMNGYTLQWYLLRDGMRWGSDVGLWLGQQHTVVVIMSWMAILFEATFFLVLLFPALAWVFIPAGIGLHTGIWLTMRAPFFQFIVLYAVFVPWGTVLKAVVNFASFRPDS
jgi:hypothetical protein